jgi:hypothetical protein
MLKIVPKLNSAEFLHLIMILTDSTVFNIAVALSVIIARVPEIQLKSISYYTELCWP